MNAMKRIKHRPDFESSFSERKQGEHAKLDYLHSLADAFRPAVTCNEKPPVRTKAESEEQDWDAV